ncbi:PREDICTED: juvenile hormone epoxide hydrolase 2-like [Nicrophorus vespilloides]|uniref:Juvenile hormone epoxide hydrolase 2-like n=1 Tax=Nicrophorus vespilloides TaxID=110193 RepID=A0ABM1M730_NICVS|nr:PREDICTED: juvenile hormone epoxide hydrolase 2-like [Nicrophorus vespilloides]
MTMYDSSHKKTHRLKALVLLASITSLGLFIDYLLEEPLLPNVNQSEILGFRSADRSIREYNINISDHIVNTVFSQVKHSAILSQPLDITYGPDTKMYKDVIKYWREKYDWRTREVYFNQYPQYTTIVQGLQIHFVHVKPETSNKTVPLLMLHGWPESFAYFYDIVPQLTSGNGDVSFELIIPSLPGHFMSDPMKDRTTVHVATLFKNLMKRLNIDRFYVFGQGVGSFIGTDMAILYPDKVMGLYNTMCLSLRKISLVKYASRNNC